jgi:HK97 gp10 family phage protein
MSKAGSVTVDTKALNKLINELDPRAGMIVRKGAFDVKAGAQDRAPVATGFLRNSIEAVEKNILLWWVEVGAEYGIYQELGTHKMRAHPFLIPALEAIRKSFLEAWKQLTK